MGKPLTIRPARCCGTCKKTTRELTHEWDTIFCIADGTTRPARPDTFASGLGEKLRLRAEWDNEHEVSPAEVCDEYENGGG